LKDLSSSELSKKAEKLKNEIERLENSTDPEDVKFI
jgi:hypothetical protein